MRVTGGVAGHLGAMETDPHRDDAEPEDESADTPPPLPAEDDDTAVGDTDQHSDADA